MKSRSALIFTCGLPLIVVIMVYKLQNRLPKINMFGMDCLVMCTKMLLLRTFPNIRNCPSIAWNSLTGWERRRLRSVAAWIQTRHLLWRIFAGVAAVVVLFICQSDLLKALAMLGCLASQKRGAAPPPPPPKAVVDEEVPPTESKDIPPAPPVQQQQQQPHANELFSREQLCSYIFAITCALTTSQDVHTDFVVLTVLVLQIVILHTCLGKIVPGVHKTVRRFLLFVLGTLVIGVGSWPSPEQLVHTALVYVCIDAFKLQDLLSKSVEFFFLDIAAVYIAAPAVFLDVVWTFVKKFSDDPVAQTKPTTHPSA